MHGPFEEHRRPVLKHTEFDSSPRRLRKNLRALDTILEGCDTWMCRRVRLMFVELVSNWQRSFAGEPISASVEILPGAVRVSFGNARRTLTNDDWDGLITQAIADLVSAWGVDRRMGGWRWFEFQDGLRAGHPATSPGA